jgi:hypothetical protein
MLFRGNLRPESAALAIMVLLLFLIFVFLFMTLTAQPALGQTYKVIHNFTGGVAGRHPETEPFQLLLAPSTSKGFGCLRHNLR